MLGASGVLKLCAFACIYRAKMAAASIMDAPKSIDTTIRLQLNFARILETPRQN